MEKKIINNWNKNKDKLNEYFKTHNQNDYAYNWNDFIKTIIIYILPNYKIEKYKEIGSYQGDIYITISDKDNNYYNGKAYYGSCSFCDSLIAINDWDYEKKPSEKQLIDYMQLALNIIQSFTLRGEDNDI